MINTTCRWCNRKIKVRSWTPYTNEFLKNFPVICHHCRVGYEAGRAMLYENFKKETERCELTRKSAEEAREIVRDDLFKLYVEYAK